MVIISDSIKRFGSPSIAYMYVKNTKTTFPRINLCISINVHVFMNIMTNAVKTIIDAIT